MNRWDVASLGAGLLAWGLVVVLLSGQVTAGPRNHEDVRHSVEQVEAPDGTVHAYACFWNAKGMGGTAMDCHLLPTNQGGDQ